MKKVLLLSLFALIGVILFAQEQPKSGSKKQFNLKNRANDHFLFQIGYLSWANVPDTIHTKGFPTTINLYLMLDFPFKSNQQMSVGIGLGMASDNMYFDKMYVGIKDLTPTLRFI